MKSVAAWLRVLVAAIRKMSRCLIRIFAIVWVLNLNSCSRSYRFEWVGKVHHHNCKRHSNRLALA